MIPNKKPVAIINSGTLADSTRATKGRKLGSFKGLTNLIPTLTDGVGQIRPGYEVYDSTHGGIDAPTGMQVTKILPIQNPSQEDVHLFFCSDSGAKIYMNPTWRGSTKDATSRLINESLAVTASFTSMTAHSTVITIGSTGLSTTDDYYNGWLMANTTSTPDEYALITDYGVSAGVATFTTVEDVGATGLNWGVTDDITLYRFLHDNPTLVPTYNDTLTNPVCANVDNSIIRVSGGQSSTSTNRPIWIKPYHKQTFFSGVTETFTYEGTYISERETKAPTKANIISYTNGNPEIVGREATITGNSLEGGYTYWNAFAYIYDGWQLSPLIKFESPTSQFTKLSGDWSATISQDNYLPTSDGEIALYFAISPATLNKRITGIAVFMAQDKGCTTLTGRVNPYYLIGTVSLLDSTIVYNLSPDAAWAFTDASGKFTRILYIDKANWDNRSVSFEEAAGYSENITDTAYSYSIEYQGGLFRALANVYVTAESATDTQNLFTNPIGGSAIVGNMSVPQPDIFPNQEAIYKLRVEPTLGSKIADIVNLGLNQFLVLKDRGCIFCDLMYVDSLPQLNMRIESNDVGLVVTNAWAKDDYGNLYFPSYQDIYRYYNGNLYPLIEKPDSQDWLATYRGFTNTTKEMTTVTYLNELKAVVFLFNLNQYMYFPLYQSWRDIKYKETTGAAAIYFKYWNKLRNGHTIGVSTEGTRANYRMVRQYAAGAYSWVYTDNATTIVPFFETGNLTLQGNAGEDFQLEKVVINRSVGTISGGDLQLIIYLDGNALSAFSLAEEDTRDECKVGPGTKRLCEYISLYYFFNTVPSAITTGFQIYSIEFYGKFLPRIRRIAD